MAGLRVPRRRCWQRPSPLPLLGRRKGRRPTAHRRHLRGRLLALDGDARRGPDSYSALAAARRLDEVGMAADLGFGLPRGIPARFFVGLLILSSTSPATAGSRRTSVAGRTTSASTGWSPSSASRCRRSGSRLGLLFGLTFDTTGPTGRGGREVVADERGCGTATLVTAIQGGPRARTAEPVLVDDGDRPVERGRSTRPA